MSNSKFTKYIKNPVVLVIGVIFGIVLIIKAKSVNTGAVGDTAAMVAVHQSDNAANVQNAAIAQQATDSENAVRIASMGFNADVTKTSLLAQVGIVGATEQTKQILGASQILATRDVKVNEQNTQRDLGVAAWAANVANTASNNNLSIANNATAFGANVANTASAHGLDMTNNQTVYSASVANHTSDNNVLIAKYQSDAAVAQAQIASSSQAKQSSGGGNTIGSIGSAISGVLSGIAKVGGLFA